MVSSQLLSSLVAGGFLVSSALANPVPDPIPDPVYQHLAPRQTVIPGGPPCGQNNATNRRCWKNNWNIDTDYEAQHPPAFNTRYYDLHITNNTNWVGPDGVPKQAMLINNQFPGPTIEADWGDYLYITVYNDLQDNGTSIHWHGIRQLGESDQDGANGVTECPIPPGKSKVYSFHVIQYGSSWYHSHFSSQYANGIIGAMVVRGPTSADWDIDLGPYTLTDYYHGTADNLMRKAELTVGGGPPDSQNIMFRGKNINPKAAGGAYDVLTLTPGKKHLLRLINPSVDNSMTVSLVGHNFLVVAMDLVPVKPIVKSQLFLAVGQRYDVIIVANGTDPLGNYWLNATLPTQNLCGRSENKFAAAIVRYSGSAAATPTNKGTPITAGCVHETGFVPVVTRSIPSASFTPSNLPLALTSATIQPLGHTVFRWVLNNMDIAIDWSHPILEYVDNGTTNYPPKANIVEVTGANRWTFWVLQNNFILPHPVHLHGHDFYILGTGSGTFNPATQTNLLTFNNPMRRDVAQMPGNGWLVIAFITDNPGCWLLHCHIAWHVSQGLGIQFMERRSEIKSLMNLHQMQPNCQAWRQYVPTSFWLPMHDSGL